MPAVLKIRPPWKDSVPSEGAIRDAKRQALLREAARAFNRQGFHATSLHDLARKLGVTKAALYHYFPSKKALLKACFDEVMAAAVANLKHAIRNGRTGREKLRMVFAGYLKDIINELSVAVVTVEDNTLSAEDRAAVVKERDRFENELRNLVREGIKDGSIVPCDPKLVTLTMLGALNWVPRWFRHGRGWSEEQLADAMTEILERAVSAQPVRALSQRVGEAPASDLPSVKPKIRAVPRVNERKNPRTTA
jgi:TetR/AcrR family transcriptional regulator